MLRKLPIYSAHRLHAPTSSATFNCSAEKVNECFLQTAAELTAEKRCGTVVTIAVKVLLQTFFCLIGFSCRNNFTEIRMLCKFTSLKGQEVINFGILSPLQREQHVEDTFSVCLKCAMLDMLLFIIYILRLSVTAVRQSSC